jgi:hypothetical protein
MQFPNLKDWTYYRDRIRRTPLLVIQGAIYYALGANITPFYLSQKEIRGTSEDTEQTLPPDISIRFLNEKDVKTIAAMPGREAPEEPSCQRLSDGMWCLGLFEGKQLVSFIWCNLRDCTYKGNKFTLKADEAYVEGLYTLPGHRGRSKAFLLENHTFNVLAAHGRTKIIGATERFNTPAVRYRRKLKTKIIASGIYVELFRRWSHTFCFKRWPN